MTRRILSASAWPLKKTQLPTPAELADLPLHLKRVTRIDITAADALILDRFRESWEHARRCVMHPDALGLEAKPIHRKHVPHTASITFADIGRLLEFGIVEVMPPTENILGTVKVFSVVEREKSRRRMIAEPSLNSQLTELAEMTLPTVEEVVGAIHRAQASLFDFDAFYHQFEMEVEARNFFVFRHASVFYRLRTIATGQRQCPSLAHALTTSIALKCAEGLDLDVTTYIDNIRFAGESAAIDTATIRLFRSCASIGATLSSEKAHATDYTFLGIKFAHKPRTVGVSEKTARKLHAFAGDFANGEVMGYTVRDFLRMIGTLIWAMRVLRVRLSNAYYLIKFVRRKTGSLDELANMWPSLAPVATKLLEQCRLSERTVADPAARDSLPAVTLFTDACPTGFGAVLFEDEKISILAGRFTCEEPIHILEARALLYGLSLLPPLRRVSIFVDNTTVLSATRAERHRDFCLNALVEAIAGKLDALGCTATLAYVRSAQNAADQPSRLTCLHETRRVTFPTCDQEVHMPLHNAFPTQQASRHVSNV